MTSIAIDEKTKNSLKAFMMKSMTSSRRRVNKSGVYLGTTAAIRTGGVGDL